MTEFPDGIYVGFPDEKELGDKWKALGQGYPIEMSSTAWTGGCDVPDGAYFVDAINGTGGEAWEAIREGYEFYAVYGSTMVPDGLTFAFPSNATQPSGPLWQPVDIDDVPDLYWYERVAGGGAALELVSVIEVALAEVPLGSMPGFQGPLAKTPAGFDQRLTGRPVAVGAPWSEGAGVPTDARFVTKVSWEDEEAYSAFAETYTLFVVEGGDAAGAVFAFPRGEQPDGCCREIGTEDEVLRSLSWYRRS